MYRALAAVSKYRCGFEIFHGQTLGGKGVSGSGGVSSVPWIHLICISLFRDIYRDTYCTCISVVSFDLSTQSDACKI